MNTKILDIGEFYFTTDPCLGEGYASNDKVKLKVCGESYDFPRFFIRENNEFGLKLFDQKLDMWFPIKKEEDITGIIVKLNYISDLLDSIKQ